MNDNPTTLGTDASLCENKSFCIILAVAFLLALISSVIFWDTYVIERGSESNRNGISETQPLTQSENDPTVPDEGSLPERVLTGTLMSVAPSGEFVRVSVVNEGIYSVGISKATTILRNNAQATVFDFTPFSSVTIIVNVLPDTEMYDFMARNISGVDAKMPSSDVPDTITVSKAEIHPEHGGNVTGIDLDN